MNVAHCIHGLGLGGAQQVIKYILRGADGQTFRHYVYSPNSGVFQDELEGSGAVVRIINRTLPKFDPFWAAALSRAMRTDRIDLVHTHLFGDSLHGYLAARAAGALPVVMTLHICAQGRTLLQRQGYRWLLTRSTRNVGCTSSVTQSWRRITTARIDTIPNAIEAGSCTCVDQLRVDDIKRGFGFQPNALVIGAVGRLVEQKGFGYLIDAFARLSLPEDNVRLVLLGDGPLRQSLQKHAESRGVAARVVFPGFRPDVASLMRVFDVVVFSSDFEGLPMALLEAMAAARCIVGTDAEGILDAVSDECEALIVPRRDPLKMSQALSRALADAELRRTLGEAARERFLREFTAERMVARYETVYREVYQAARRVLSREAGRVTPLPTEQRGTRL